MKLYSFPHSQPCLVLPATHSILEICEVSGDVRKELADWKLPNPKTLKSSNSSRLGVILTDFPTGMKSKILKRSLQKTLLLQLKTRCVAVLSLPWIIHVQYLSGQVPMNFKMFALPPGHAVHPIPQPPLPLSTTRGLRKADGMGRHHFPCMVLHPLSSPAHRQNTEDGAEDSEALEAGGATERRNLGPWIFVNCYRNKNKLQMC